MQCWKERGTHLTVAVQREYVKGLQMLKVTTENGRVYLIDRENGFWKRMPKHEDDLTGGWWDRLWTLQVGTHFAMPWDSPEGSWEHASQPEIGKFMFISGKDEWWVTTEIVSIEDVDIHYGQD